MIHIINDRDSFTKIYEKNQLPVILWGIGEWGKLFIEEMPIEINDVCDADKEKQGTTVAGFVVLSPEEIQKKYDGKRFYIINSYGTTRSLQAGLYIMVCRYDYDALLVNLHTNIGFDLGIEDFIFAGKKIKLNSHLHNCGYENERMSERSIEVAMAQEWLKHNDEVIEVGAVTPYYYPGEVKDVVDPADEHYFVNIHESIFDVDLSSRNVLCLSTVEHIGTGQYGVGETRNAEMAIEKILAECNHCLITTPIGENPLVDSYLKKHYKDDNLVVYYRRFYGNNWNIANKQEIDIDKLILYCKEVAEMYEKRQLIGGNCGNIVIVK